MQAARNLLAIEGGGGGMLHCRGWARQNKGTRRCRDSFMRRLRSSASLSPRFRRPSACACSRRRSSPGCWPPPAAGWAARRVDVGEVQRRQQADPAEQIEAAGAQEYQKMMRDAAQQRALAPATSQVRSDRQAHHSHPRPGIRAPANGAGSHLSERGAERLLHAGGKIAFYTAS